MGEYGSPELREEVHGPELLHGGLGLDVEILQRLALVVSHLPPYYHLLFVGNCQLKNIEIIIRKLQFAKLFVRIPRNPHRAASTLAGVRLPLC